MNARNEYTVTDRDVLIEQCFALTPPQVRALQMANWIRGMVVLPVAIAEKLEEKGLVRWPRGQVVMQGRVRTDYGTKWVRVSDEEEEEIEYERSLVQMHFQGGVDLTALKRVVMNRAIYQQLLNARNIRTGRATRTA